MFVREKITAGTVLNRYDFQDAIFKEGPQKANMRGQSVTNVLNYFKAVRPNMSFETRRETLHYLNNDSWVGFVTQTSSCEVFKSVIGDRNPNLRALYYPELIIIHATFPNDTRAHELIDKYSKHWDFEFSVDGPSYPSGLDAATEYRLFRGVYANKQSQKVKTEDSTASQTKDNVSQNNMLNSVAPKEMQTNLPNKVRVVETEASMGNKTMDAVDANAVASKESCELLSPQSSHQLSDQMTEDAVANLVIHNERVRNLEEQLEQAKKDRDRHQAEMVAYHREKSNAYKRLFEYHAAKALEYSTGAFEKLGTSGSTPSQLNHERPEKRLRQT